MDPHDSPEEAAFRTRAREFLESHASPVPSTRVMTSAIVAEWSIEEEAARIAEARAWQRLKHDNGWAGISWPEGYGGAGRSLIEDIIFRQEEARFDIPHDALIVGLGWCGPAVMLHGDESQKARFLPPLLRGDDVWCQLFSEPAAGSDSAGMRTTAVRDGEEWVINGQKVWTTFAHHSDWGLCVARHDSDLPKHQGLTAFMVDMRSAGVEARPLRQMTDSANFNEVFLHDVRVPDANRIGGVGDGWRVVLATYMWERIGAVSGGDHLLAGLAKLLRESGTTADPAVRIRYARLYETVAALQYTGLRLLTAISQGRMPGPEGSIMKLGATLTLTDLFSLALEVQGAAGMLVGPDAPWAGEWHAAFLGAPGLRIAGGTDEVQRNIIAERVLGLPGDYRVDKAVPFRDVPTG